MDEELLSGASVTHPDWKGTAQLDERCTRPWEGLARAINLDDEQWQIVCFKIGGTDQGFHLRVYATPREVWDDLAPEGELEVTEFIVNGVDPLALLRQMTHAFELDLRLRGLEHRPLRVMAGSNRPTELFMHEHLGPHQN